MNLAERLPRVLLADDHPALLRTAAGMLAPYFEIVAAVNNGKTALEETARANPDLVLLDIRMPEIDGIRAARELKRRQAGTEVVFLTAQEDDDYISEALAAGARGYILKRRMQSDLLIGLNVVRAGHFFISPHAFIGHSNEEQGKPNEEPHWSAGHVMGFYLDEGAFINRVSEVACSSLAEDKVVIMFLRRAQLTYVSRRLAASGIDVDGAIAWGGYRPFSIEGIASMLMRNGELDVTNFLVFFDPVFDHAARAARKKCSEVIVLGNLSSAFLDFGYDRMNAFRVEGLWNQLAQKHSCTIHCGCLVERLVAKNSREALARICEAHSNVISIDRYLQTNELPTTGRLISA